MYALPNPGIPPCINCLVLREGLIEGKYLDGISSGESKSLNFQQDNALPHHMNMVLEHPQGVYVDDSLTHGTPSQRPPRTLDLTSLDHFSRYCNTYKMYQTHISTNIHVPIIRVSQGHCGCVLSRTALYIRLWRQHNVNAITAIFRGTIFLIVIHISFP